MLAAASAHSVSAAQVCVRWTLQRGAIAALGTGADASKVEQYTQVGSVQQGTIFTTLAWRQSNCAAVLAFREENIVADSRRISMCGTLH